MTQTSGVIAWRPGDPPAARQAAMRQFVAARGEAALDAALERIARVCVQADADRTEAPDVSCVCCGEVLEAAWQPGLGHKPGFYLLTCATPTCPLCHYTFGQPDYPPANLDAYLAPRKAAR